MGLKLIKNNKSHWPFILYLRTHPDNLYGFVERDPIKYQDHIEYMEQFGGCYFICIWDGIPVGFIGDVGNDVRLAVHPDFQAKGIGVFMLNKYVELGSRLYKAKVLWDNFNSQRLFEKCGFKRVDGEMDVYKYYEKDTTQPL